MKDSDSLKTSLNFVPKKWMLLTRILSSKKKFNEKAFKSNFQDKNLVLPDIDCPLRSNSSDNVVFVSVSSSAAPSISTPEFAVLRPEAVDVAMSVSTDPHRHSRDIV